MSLLSSGKRVSDNFYALRFLRMLTMPWEKTAAFKTGVIDKNGNRIAEPATDDQHDAYTMFHRLVFNIKRLTEKVPGSTARKLASYATALYLLKEQYNMTEESLLPVVEFLDLDTIPMCEEIIHLNSADDAVGDFLGMLITKESMEDLMDELGGDVNTVDSSHIKGQIFKVPNPVFRKFAMGRNKYERWQKYLETDSVEQMKIKSYCQKNPKSVVLIQCEETGAMRAIRSRVYNSLTAVF